MSRYAQWGRDPAFGAVAGRGAWLIAKRQFNGLHRIVAAFGELLAARVPIFLILPA